MVLQKWNRWRGGGVASVLIGALLLAVLTTENALPADDEAKVEALPSDLAKIPSDSVLVLSGRVADLWSSFVKPVREKEFVEAATRQLEKLWGMHPEQIERATLVLLTPPPSPNDPLIFLHTVKPYDRAKVLAAGKYVKEEKYKGKIFYTSDKQGSVFPLDDRSLVYGKSVVLREWIDHPAPKREGNLAGTLHLAARQHSMVCGVNVKVINDAVGNQLPGEVEPFRPLLQAVSGTLTMDVGEEARALLSLNFPTEKDAQVAVKPAQTGLDLARAGLDRGVAELGKQKDTTQIVELLKQVQSTVNSAKIERQGKMLQTSANLKFDAAKVRVALQIAVQKIRASAARSQSANNLKQIALAMHNYNDTYGHLPPQATYDKNGKPMLSWRVMILPFIEQQNLYNRFHLDEPWDSEHNKKLLQYTIRTYTSPQQDEKSIKEHETYYQGFVGKDAFFEGKKGLRLPADFPDGTSNTIMIVEASKGVPWTKPEDIPYDAEKPVPKLGLPGSSSYMAALCDGSVRTITTKLTQRTLRLAITRNDGLPMGPDW